MEHRAWGDNFEFGISNCEIKKSMYNIRNCPSDSHPTDGFPDSQSDIEIVNIWLLAPEFYGSDVGWALSTTKLTNEKLTLEF